MNVPVSGGTNFIGPPVVRRLVSLGQEVTGFHVAYGRKTGPARRREDLPRPRRTAGHPHIEYRNVGSDRPSDPESR